LEMHVVSFPELRHFNFDTYDVDYDHRF